MRSAIACAFLAAGCTSSGSLELQLTLPTDVDLRPANMTTVSVLATSPVMDPIANTSALSGTSFSAGDLPVGSNIQIDVLLHDVSNRLVGVGEASQLVDLKADQPTTLAIPVRRPFVYAADGTQLYSFDPTLDPRDLKFQGELAGLTMPQLAVSVGGDRLLVASTNQLQIVDTATHKVTGQPIVIGGAVHDAAPVPGSHKVAIAHGAGIAIVDLDSGMVQNAAGPSVDRITVGPDVGGTLTAFGLVGRVAPPSGPVDPCTGTSSLVTVAIDAPAALQPMALAQAVSDLAASPDAAMLVAALPCANKVSRLDGTTFTDVSMLERAAVVAVAGQRIWAAGMHPSTPICSNSSGNTTACTIGAPATCPGTAAAVTIDYVTAGSHLIVQSIPIGGGMPVVLDVPERRETMVSTDDPGGQHAQVLHSFGVLPLDLVALPGGQYVGLVTSSTYFIGELVDGLGNIILPCLEATTGDWLLLDLASSSTAQRVRTECLLTTGPHDSSTIFRNWACDDAPLAEKSQFGNYQPTSIGALFGAR